MPVSFNKKTIRLIVIYISCLILAVLATSLIISSREVTRIAFYDIPDTIQVELKQVVQDFSPDSRISFTTINSKKPFTSKAAEKFHVVFTLNSRTAIELEGKDISSELMAYFPTKIRYSTMQNNKTYALPLLLDHFQLMLYRTYKNDVNLSEPNSWEDFKSYLKSVKTKADFPLIAIGSDDQELWGFVSSVAQSMYSAEEYFEICQELNKAQAMFADLPYRIRVTLDEIKHLENEGLLHKNWLNATKEDVSFLMEQHQLGSIATYLSTQRTLPYILVKYYDSYCIPQDNTDPFGLIAPTICAVKIKDSRKVNLMMEKLVSSEVQSLLSEKTMLAPAVAVAESSDVQSDDVRFWCSASPAGPVPSLQNAAFRTPDRMHSYADKIRDYLK